MTYFEVKKSVTALLRGDNSKAEELLAKDDSYLLMAIRDVSMRCIPLKLKETFTVTKTDVFRRLASILDEELDVYSEYYIKVPVVEITDESIVEMDEELMQAIILFMCSYLSNKKNKDYIKSAEETISFYDSYSVDFTQYEV